ncbi:hypothetical protein B5F77_02270 [Parabacteroides sp. An277]|uniref:DUF349 domain-containing protein n=1 Tax=Parabacteroides sp. An277 TaxID=1965619 RepID=UPI000B37DEFB|nr:DUF349 domain-containing protein [Parabacteroides sp. An277]OUO55039.1 hypothetical protein B5F77_02270 [Parabacteroides sp. An277]
MKDTLETNLTGENTVELNETNEQVAATPQVADVATESKEAEVESAGKLTKDEILSRLKSLVEAPVENVRGEVEALKQAYYKIRHNEVEAQKSAFLSQGGAEEDFAIPEDTTEAELKDLLAIYKEKKAAMLAEEEKQKEANYALKLQLIEQLKALCASQDDFNKLYNEFKAIQQKWKEIKQVPEEHANELWHEYQNYSEQFYDLIKINNQFRDYDFKKNLELKTALCETVEKLEVEPDVISAFHQLQKLHQQWREIGPVAKDLREDLWARFKAASAVINKRHQQYFEDLKAKEQENLVAKTAICEQIESIDYAKLKTFKDWDKKNSEVLDLQQQWRTIGFTPKKFNTKIFERFRAACDIFFSRKVAFFKEKKVEMEKNLEKKRALCEQAEALKDSTDWKETTDKFVALQKEWKAIGQVPFRHSDAIWKRFITACDYFFAQREQTLSSQKSEEQANLKAKKELIEKVKSLDESLEPDEAINLLKDYMAEWNTIGFVPFRDKDKIYKAFHQAVDAQFDRLKVDRQDRRIRSFRSNLSEMAGKGKGKLYTEREKLMRSYDRMKSELQTYENNIGFLSVHSKGGSGLIKEMERKIASLREEMELIVQKIDAIDENLE